MIYVPSNSTSFKPGYYDNFADVKAASSGLGPGSGSSGSSSSSSSVDNSISSVNNLVGSLKSGTSYGDLARSIFNYSEHNSAFNASEAQKARDWSAAQNLQAMEWSAKEAQKTRDWQESLSNTAHQREVKDLIAAGLNPILSVNGGASSPSGASGNAYSGGVSSASADSSASSVAGLFSSVLNSAAQLQMQDKQLAFNSAQLAQAKELAQLASDTQLKTSQNALLGSQISANAQMAAAGTSAAALQKAHEIDSDIKKYVADQTDSRVRDISYLESQTRKDTSLVGSFNDFFKTLNQNYGQDFGSNFGSSYANMLSFLLRGF